MCSKSAARWNHHGMIIPVLEEENDINDLLVFYYYM
jgi:hypothetical protein